MPKTDNATSQTKRPNLIMFPGARAHRPRIEEQHTYPTEEQRLAFLELAKVAARYATDVPARGWNTTARAALLGIADAMRSGRQVS